MVVLLSTDKMWVTQNMWIISGKGGGFFRNVNGHLKL